MNITKEILLLSDALSNEENNEDMIVILIKNIYEGLDVPNPKKDEVFWKRKISFHLMYRTLPKTNNDINFSQWPVSCMKTTSWQFFFRICFKSSIFEAFVSSMFDSLPESIVDTLLYNYSQVIRKDHFVHDFIMSTSILLSQLLLSSNHGLLRKGLQLLNQSIASYEHIEEAVIESKHVECYHISGVKSALNALKTSNVDYKVQTEKGIIYHVHVLKNLSSTNMSSLIGLYQKVLPWKNIKLNINSEQSVGNLEIHNMIRTFVDGWKIFLKNYISKLSKFDESGCVSSSNTSSYVLHLQNFIVELDNFVSNITNRTKSFILSKTQNKKEVGLQSEWTFERALLTATHLLHGYSEATLYLLNFMRETTTDVETIYECLTSLIQHPVCMYTSQHIVELCRLIGSFLASLCGADKKNQKVKKSVICASDLLMLSYHNLSLNSKFYLLQGRCNPSIVECTSVMPFKANLFQFVALNEINRKVNMVFNKLTKVCQSDSASMNDLLHKICDVAFIDPKAVLNKIAAQIVHHEEHHVTLFHVFCRIPFLVSTTDKQGRNALLSDLCKFASNHIGKDGAKNVCSFLSLLLHAGNSISHFSFLFNLLFQDYILSSFDICEPRERSCSTISIEFTLALAKCIFQDNGSQNLQLFDMCTFLYFLLRTLDGNQVGDDITSEIKYTVHILVEVVRCRINNNTNNTSLVKWLKKVTGSLNWMTQLYLQPIFSSTELHRIVLPASLTTICNFCDDNTFSFADCYGEGTGLTAWLQCLLVDPGLLPLSSLSLENLSATEQQVFSHGMVLALSQVLPFSLEEDWHIILQTLKVLLCQNSLHITLAVSRIKVLPPLYLELFHVSLRIVELFHRVTLIIGSRCCSNWMTESLWMRYCKCYAITVKQIIFHQSPREFSKTNDLQGQSFLLSILFSYSCDLLKLLESQSITSMACDSIFVLLLEILNAFCSASKVNIKKYADNEESNDSSKRKEIQDLQASMLSAVKLVRNETVEKALTKKLRSVA